MKKYKHPFRHTAFVLAYTLFIMSFLSSCVTNDEYPNTVQGNAEALWKILDEHYCFFEQKGIDWNAVRNKYLKQFDNSMTERQQFEVMANMLSELKDGHVNLYTSFNAARYWSWREDYPQNYSDSLLRKYLKTDYLIASGMDYTILDDNIGYLRCESFQRGIGAGNLNDILLYFQPCRALIIDVRNNGGGLENEAVDIVNLFVPKGVTVVSNRGKLKRLNHAYQTKNEPLDTLMPIVVLVNGNTASSSEITSGALQDLDRAVVMGTKTFGKGLVQMTVDLPYHGNLKLTSQKYYIPSGRCIQAINYNRRRMGGDVQTPDSLLRIFHTRNGREVRDGGGIQPDVEVKPDTASNIQSYLMTVVDSTETVLDYVTHYRATHDKIAEPSAFELSDADYEAFKKHVLSSGFKYDGVSEKILAELKKTAVFEGYYDGAKADFAALEQKLKHNMAKDLDYNRERIMQALAGDIVTMYYYQRGGVEYSLKHDKQIKTAEALLNNEEAYQKILHPTKK